MWRVELESIFFVVWAADKSEKKEVERRNSCSRGHRFSAEAALFNLMTAHQPSHTGLTEKSPGAAFSPSASKLAQNKAAASRRTPK